MRRLRDDRGASAVLIAILLPALLLGLGAVVITVGGWYVARGMDQNAADAAVIAVARTCLDDGGCDPSAAEPYVDGVSNGSLAAQALKVCGTAPSLPSCPSVGVSEDDYSCPVPHANPYVTVFVAPSNDDGSPTMDNWFSGGDQEVGACAQAALGPPGTGTGVAVTISKCEWELNTAGGETFAEPPSPAAFPFTINARRASDAYLTDPDDPESNFYVENEIEHEGSASIAGSETVLATHGDVSFASCGGDAENAPGHFGWLESDDCYVEVSDPYEGDTGNDPEPCYDAFWNSRENDEPVYLPIYNSVEGSGSGASHDLAGFAAFVVTGWDVTNGGKDWPDKKVASKLGLAQGVDNPDYCGKPPDKGYTGSPSDICIYGYFTEALVEGGDFSGGGSEDLGLDHAFLTG